MGKRWSRGWMAAMALGAVLPAQALCVAHAEIPGNAQRGDDGRLHGSGIALAEQLEQRSGIKLQNRLVPLARALQEVDRGDCDLTMLLPVVYGGQTRMLGPVGSLEVVLLPRKGVVPPADGRWPGASVVSLASGIAWGPQTVVSDVQNIRVVNPSSMFGMVKAGWADAALVVRRTMERVLASGEFQASDFGVPISLGRLPLQLYAGPGVSARDAERLAAAAKAMAAAKP